MRFLKRILKLFQPESGIEIHMPNVTIDFNQKGDEIIIRFPKRNLNEYDLIARTEVEDTKWINSNGNVDYVGRGSLDLNNHIIKE